MRLAIYIFVLCFYTTGLTAQDMTDSRLPGAVTVEVLGNSAIPGISVNYHRFFSFDSLQDPAVTFAFRIGAGTVRYNSSPIYVLFPTEVSVMFGRNKFKPELGLGYTPIFGNIRIRTGTGASDITKVNSIDYLVGRIGFSFKSSQRGKLFFRLAWTPKYYLNRNPISIDDNSILSKRLGLGWAGVSIGFVF